MAVTMKKNSSKDREDFKFMLDRLKESVDPRYLLESLGFNATRESGKEIRCACKIHGGDNQTSFRFNKDTRTWVCFSHRCHEVFGNDVVGLVKGSLNVEFMDAVRHLKSMVGELDSGDYIEHKRKKEKEAFVKSQQKPRSRSSIVTEDCLRQFKPFRSQYFINKGFSKDTLDFFEVAGGYTDSYGYIRDIIPIRDAKDILVGYSLRDIRDLKNLKDHTEDFKYIHTTGFDKDKVIYNLNNAKELLAEKPLIIVEGFKSVWRLHEMGIKNVAAVMGAHVTSGQCNLIYTYAQKGIVLFFDGDGPGAAGTVRTVEELRGKVDNIFTIFMTEEGMDPADLDEDTLRGYLNVYV